MNVIFQVVNEFRLLFPDKSEALYTSLPRISKNLMIYMRDKGKMVSDCGIRKQELSEG